MSRRLILALGLSLGLASASAAAPITWAFEGTVRILEGETVELAGSLGVTLGAPVSGHVRYRDDVFSVGGPEAGIFDGALLGFEVAIGSFETGFESLFGCCHFYVRLNPGHGDSYALSGGGGGPDILFPQGVPLSLYLFADTPGVIPNLLLPQAPPALSALRPFSIADWSQFYSAGTGLEIGAHADTGWPDGRIVVELTSLALVPEPEAFALLALAFVALAARRRPTA